MKKLIQKTITMCLILVFIATSTIPVFAAGNTFRVAKIDDLSGVVTILKAGGEKSFAAFKGMSLAQGDTIATMKNAWVNLYIDDDKEVKIGDNTLVNLSELGGSLSGQNEQTGVKLWFGKVYAKIKNKLNVRAKFEIKTPTTVAGARGTQFYVGQEEGRTDIAVLEGTVSATTYVPQQQSQGSDGTPPPLQEIETTLQANQQITLDQEVLSQQPEPQVQVQTVTTQTLDLLVLEAIQQDSTGINQELLNNIEQVIEQIQEEQAVEEQRQEEEQANETPPPPVLVYDEVVNEPSAPPTPPTYTPPTYTYTPPSITTAPLAGNITVVNNGGANDYVKVDNLTSDDIVKIYGADNQNLLTPAITATGTTVYSPLLNLTTTGGTLFVSVQRSVMSESTHTAIAYLTEVDCQTSNPLSGGDVYIENNVGSADAITVNNIQSGDIIKVYGTDPQSSPTPAPGALMLYKIAQSTSLTESITLPDDLEGLLYVSIIKVGKSESILWDFYYLAVGGPPPSPPSPDDIHITNEMTGDDEVALDSWLSVDSINVYYEYDETFILLGTDNGEGTVTITDGFPNTLSQIYVSVTNGMQESSRTAVNIPAPESALINSPIQGTAAGSTMVYASPQPLPSPLPSPPPPEDTFEVKVSPTLILTPTAGTTTTGTTPYSQGTDILGVDATLYKYLGVYEVNEDNKIIAFNQFELTASEIRDEIPAFNSVSATSGETDGKTIVNCSPTPEPTPAPPNVLKYVISPAAVRTPYAGEILTGGFGFSSGDEISGIAPGWHVGIYEVTSNNNIVKFSDITILANQIAGTVNPPAAPTILSVQGDEGTSGVDGLDFTVNWEPSETQNVICQLIYILPVSSPDIDTTTQIPVAVISDNETTNWQGSSSDTDSLGGAFTAGTYYIYVVAVSPSGMTESSATTIEVYGWAF